jgi:hypothetical protein
MSGIIRLLALTSLAEILISFLACQSVFAEGSQVGAEYGLKNIRSFLDQYCLKCHGPVKPKGEFRVDAAGLATDFHDLATAGRWKEIVNVLNSHEMPPKQAAQPTAAETAQVVDWVTDQLARAELARRDKSVVLRRLNRAEYRNTIRDLIGIDFDTSGFPQDPPAAGFDNNGSALAFSPLLMELYLNAAQQILDRALVSGPRPVPVKWRFEPKAGPIDARRVKVGDNPHAILNGGNNTMEGDFVVIHHDNYDKSINARGFKMPVEGVYTIRIHAAGRVPNGEQVVRSAKAILQKRLEKEIRDDPRSERRLREDYERDLKHFQTDRMYDYGPPRIKLVVRLGPQPRTVAEFDVDATVAQPKAYEFTYRFTTEWVGINIEYAYDIPQVLENFWMQRRDDFARPELLVDWFEIEGPQYPSWPPPSHTNILFDSPLRDRDERAYAREVIARFMRKAYRRPVTAEEIDVKLALFDRAKQETNDFLAAIKQPLIAVLVSPHFLYLTEPAADAGRMLTDHEYAARLSYFLWSSMPDDELFQLADSGKLKEPSIRRAQVNRMLASPKSEAFVRNFVGQWLGLREVGINPPAPDLYPHYDRHLERSIVQESEAFFRTILQEDLSVLNLLKSDFVVINERLARFYGIPGVRGDHFRKVPVPPGVMRGGIVTQASILTITSNGTRTSPVKRGTWVLKNILGIDPGLPVANAGEIAPKVPGIDKATVRKRLEIHRQLDQCARCHNKIDPLGFALENYNAAGEWREQEGFGYKGRIQEDDPKIDASAEMPDGTKIVGVGGLQNALLAKQDLFLNCLASKMLTYALGRELGFADKETVRSAVEAMKREDYTLRSLIQAIVASKAFASK